MGEAIKKAFNLVFVLIYKQMLLNFFIWAYGGIIVLKYRNIIKGTVSTQCFTPGAVKRLPTPS